MARGRADSPPASGGGGVGGRKHEIFPSKLFVSPIASDREGVLVGQVGEKDRSAPVVDRSSAAFGRSAAEPTPPPPSSEKGPISQPMMRSLQPALDDGHRRGFPAKPARKTTLASPARTSQCQACKAINDPMVRTCQASPRSALRRPAPEACFRFACLAMPVPLAEHRRHLASHGLCAVPWHTDIAERSDTCPTYRSVGETHRPFGRLFCPPPSRPFRRRPRQFRAWCRGPQTGIQPRRAASWHSATHGRSSV